MKKGDSHSLTRALLSGDRIALAKAITLIESASPRHEKQAQQIIEDILPFSGKSIRIGVTGVPGAGKSTFIETFGNYIIKEKTRKVAVLAIDPTSERSKGSILGDKTRMNHLARNESAFIRPSPSSGAQGGVAESTREAILLCEASGFDVILVETVGVGQSETVVRSMVDFMLLLLLPGAGDELQGMKRGIVELADLIAVNKADGDNLPKAKAAQVAYQQALHLFPPSENGWKSGVVTCSSLTGKGIPEIWSRVEDFEKLTKKNASFDHNRKSQLGFWLKERLLNAVYLKYNENTRVKKQLALLQRMVEERKISVRHAAGKLSKML